MFIREGTFSAAFRQVDKLDNSTEYLVEFDEDLCAELNNFKVDLLQYTFFFKQLFCYFELSWFEIGNVTLKFIDHHLIKLL